MSTKEEEILIAQLEAAEAKLALLKFKNKKPEKATNMSVPALRHINRTGFKPIATATAKTEERSDEDTFISLVISKCKSFIPGTSALPHMVKIFDIIEQKNKKNRIFSTMDLDGLKILLNRALKVNNIHLTVDVIETKDNVVQICLQ